MDQTPERYPFPPYANGWFRIAYSNEVEIGQVLPLYLLGRDLVLYRDEAGEAHVLDAYCRHLGANLGYGGKVEGAGLRCPFHGWKWDGAGRCVDIPYAKKIPSKAQIRAWPSVEKGGLILIWHHAEEEPPGFELPDLPEYESDEWTDYEVRRWRVRARWLDMNENAVDQVHFRYVHGTKTIPDTQVETEGPVLRCSSRMKLGTPEGVVSGGIDTTDYGPAFQTVRLSGIIDTLMVNTATPIDEEYTDVTFAYTIKKAGGADASHGVGRAIIRDLEKQMAQDIPIWENKKYFDRPLLCDGDGKIGVYRKWFRQFFSQDAIRPRGDE